MLNLVRRLFWRHVERNRVVRRSARDLRDASGRLLAEAAEVTVSGGRVRVRVRPPCTIAVAEGFRLEDSSGFSTPMPPEPGSTGDDGGTWFAASVPEHWGPLRLASAGGGGTAALPMPGRLAALGAVTLVPGFALRLLPALPGAVRWLRSRDPRLRHAVLQQLGLADSPPALLDGRLFRQAPGHPEASQPPQGITIVLPVHNAFDLLPETIGRIAANTDLPWHLVVVEDASTDARVRPWLRERLAALPACHVTLIENERNLGFIGSVNLGFGHALGRRDPVVLLNSDAFVPPRWASRLIAPLLADASVATVTPMSNDSELTTVPVIACPQALEPGEADALDRIAAGFAGGAGMADMPTGVGFCMAIARDWLARAPRFDPAFGRGYGEEVDWCRRLSVMGARHVGLPGLFVEHRGAASFGTAEKQAAIARGNAVIAARHPRFFEQVAAFVEADPLVTPRLALGVALAAVRTRGALPLYIAHGFGGGAEIWLQHRIAAHLNDPGEGSALVLRVGGLHRWQLELHLGGAPMLAGVSDDLDTIAAILAPAPRLRLCYSCAVGDPDPVSLPGALLGLLRPQDGLEMVFHDFLPLSPSFTLLDSRDHFRGVPPSDDIDPAHQARRPDGSVVTLREWRDAWGALAARASRLIAFSDDSARHVAAVWPHLAAGIEVRPHALHTPVPRCDAPAAGQSFNVAVLGNINRHKGIGLLAELARRLDAIPGAPGLVVIGRTDPNCPLPRSVHVHGPYVIEELDLLAHRHRVGAWLIPSICPETFSYTTHETLATGLPVIGLGLGAQGEALRRHRNGLVVAAGDHEAMVQGLLQAILNLAAGRGPAAAATPEGCTGGGRGGKSPA